jgi:nitrite reductase/ring-hydroxylating ferredoxin subunit
VAEVDVGPASDFNEGVRKNVRIDDREVTVLSVDGDYFAIENKCLHMGGPVGEGIVIGKVEAILDEDKRLLGERFSETEKHIVCPWHGYEYDLSTGQFCGDRSRKLRTYQAFEREGHVYVVV